MLLDQIRENFGLTLLPLVLGQVELLETQPLEHASVGRRPRYQLRNELPVLLVLR